MPKATPKKQHGRWAATHPRVTLTAEYKQMLRQYARPRSLEERAMFERVSDVLGLWPGLEEILDDAPTPAAVATTLRTLADLVNQLRVSLDDLDTRSSKWVEAILHARVGAGLGVVRQHLLRLRAELGGVASHLRGQGRGRPHDYQRL